MARRDEGFWAVRRHALGSLRAGELLGTSLPDGVDAVAMWRAGQQGAVLFHACAGADVPWWSSPPSMHLETGQIRPRLKRWKWTGACGFGLSDDVPSPPADGLGVVGGTQDETMKLCAGGLVRTWSRFE